MARLELTLANDLAEVSRMAAAIEAFCEEAALPPAAAHALALALDELATNTIGYGYAEGARGTLALSLAVEPGRATAELRDDARPFDPTRAPEPDLEAELDERAIGGLGIHLVREMMDEIGYERRDGWNVTTLVKRLED